MAVEEVRNLIDGCNNITVLSGSKMMFESGLKGVRQEKYAYDIESKYGYSPEEIVTEECLNRRSEVFYRYYREEILGMEEILPDFSDASKPGVKESLRDSSDASKPAGCLDIKSRPVAGYLDVPSRSVIGKLKPNEGHYAISRLEKRGKLLSVITRNVYGLHSLAGVTKVIELHGSVHKNYCPKCGKVYGPQYIVDAGDIPRCEQCRVMLTPGLALYGTTVDNGLISRAAEAVSNADMLLIVGASTRSTLTSYLLQYYNGKNLVTVNDKPGEGDELADYTLYGNCGEILGKLT